MISLKDFDAAQRFGDDDNEIYAVRGDLPRSDAFQRIRNAHLKDWDEDILHLGLSEEDLFLGSAWLGYSEEEGEVIPHVQMTGLNIPADVKTIEVWLIDLA